MENKRIIFDTADANGKAIQLAVIRPTNKINQDANMCYNVRMAELIRDGAKNSSKRLLLRAELEEYLKETGIWTLKDQLEVEKLALEIRSNELLLKKGGIKLSEGRALALQMAEKRQMILARHAKRLHFDSITIESQAENFRFEHLLVKCLVTVDLGKPFLKNHEDYIERQDEVAIIDGARVLANMMYGLDDNIHKNMFELVWLKDAGMIDDSGRYVNSNGTIIDRDGRLINKDGRYIDKDGNLIDTFGRHVDESGNLIVADSLPFIDDNTGKEISVGDIGLHTQCNKTRTKSMSKKATKKNNNT